MSSQVPNKIQQCLIKYDHIQENNMKEKLKILRTRKKFLNKNL